MNNKRLKSGINRPIICKNCGKRVGYLRIKSRLKWKMIWYGIGIALAFEIIANTIVYLLLR